MIRLLTIALLAPHLGCVSRSAQPTLSSAGDHEQSNAAGDADVAGDAAGDAAGDNIESQSLELLSCNATPTAPACQDLQILFHLDTAGTLADASGNDNDGTCTSCPTFDPSAGRFGGGYVFDGDDYFEIPDHPSLDISGAVTVSAWFRPTELRSGDFTVIVAKILGSPLRSNYWLGHLAEEFVVTFIDENDSGWHNHSDGRTWSVDAWYHLVGVIDNDNDRVQLYVNGDLVIDDSETATMGQEDGSLYIGDGPGDQGAVGVIDEVAIWRRALTASEVATLYP